MNYLYDIDRNNALRKLNYVMEKNLFKLLRFGNCYDNIRRAIDDKVYSGRFTVNSDDGTEYIVRIKNKKYGPSCSVSYKDSSMKLIRNNYRIYEIFSRYSYTGILELYHYVFYIVLYCKYLKIKYHVVGS